MGLLAGISISWKLWHSADRLFPLLPVSSGLSLPPWSELVLLLGLAISLIASFFLSRRLLTGLATIILLTLCLADQIRWQPWIYQCLLMLLPLLWLKRDGTSADLTLKIERFIMIAIYFWSGFHKRGSEFKSIWTESIAKPLLDLLDQESNLHKFVIDFAEYVPFMEIIIAAALLFSLTRWLGIMLACSLHLGILILVGPLMGDHNQVIWPWNIAMIALVIVLFRSKNEPPSRTRSGASIPQRA